LSEKICFSLLRKVDRRTAELVREAATEWLRPVSDRVHKITADNGNEFAERQRTTQELGHDFFFT
jgi:IS30 family transposase